MGNGKIGDTSPTLDKIIPERGYVKGNVQVISHKANSMKRNASLDELLLFSRKVIEQFGDTNDSTRSNAGKCGTTTNSITRMEVEGN